MWKIIVHVLVSSLLIFTSSYLPDTVQVTEERPAPSDGGCKC